MHDTRTMPQEARYWIEQLVQNLESVQDNNDTGWEHNQDMLDARDFLTRWRVY